MILRNRIFFFMILSHKLVSDATGFNSGEVDFKKYVFMALPGSVVS